MTDPDRPAPLSVPSLDHPVFGSTPLLLTVNDVARLLSLSRTTVYELLMAGTIDSVLVGGRNRRVPYDAVLRYVEGLPIDRRGDSADAHGDPPS